METTRATEARTLQPTGCCPPFDPTPWEKGEISFEDHVFLKDHLRSIFHVPLGMDRHMAHDVALIDAAHAQPEQRLMLSDASSPWATDLYIDVTRDVPGGQMERMSGTFLTRVFEGPYSQMGKWTEQMNGWVKAQGRPLEKLYFGYTTCPACAKAYGKNYVVAFAKVGPAVHA